MIDIIIPAFNAHEKIKDALFSIAFQSIVDKICVYIVNDSSDKDYSEIIDIFSKFIKIKELKLKKNSGPGVARQYGIKHSNSDYVLFIDSDDVFNNCFSVELLYNSIITNNADIVISKIISEVENNNFEYFDFEDTWLHGKIYRRSSLKNYNINFNDSRVNEDVGFNYSMTLQKVNKYYLDEYTYIWKNNLESITRKNNYEFQYNSVGALLVNILYAIETALNGNPNIESISDFIYSELVVIYFKYIIVGKKYNFDQISNEMKKLIEYSNRYSINYQKKGDIFINIMNDILYKYELNYLDIMNFPITFDEFLGMW